MSDPVAAYLDALAPAVRATVEPLRVLALAAHPDVTEHIKWNAPSFCVGGEDRITLSIAPKGDVRVVVHRGAKVKDTGGFSFDDPAGLATWPAVDRGVMSFADAAAVAGSQANIADFFRRWLAATS